MQILKSKKTALITGIHGQDGNIVSRLLKADFHVYGFSSNIDRNKSMSEISDKNIINSWNLSEKTFEKILNEIKPDIIFHLAAIHNSSTKMVDTEQKFKDEMVRVHVDYTNYFISWVSQNSKSKLVVSLTSQIFGNPSENKKVNSKSVIDPINFYSETKAKSLEAIIEAQENNLKVYAAILFPHTSKHAKNNFVVQDFVSQLELNNTFKSKEIILNNFLSQIDLSDAIDICRGMYSLSSIEKGENLVLGSGKPRILKDIFEEYLSYKKLNHIKLISRSPRTLPTFYADEAEYSRKIPDWAPTDNLNLLIESIFSNYGKSHL